MKTQHSRVKDGDLRTLTVKERDLRTLTVKDGDLRTPTDTKHCFESSHDDA